MAAADEESDVVEVLNLRRSEFVPDVNKAIRGLRRQEGELLYRLRSIHADSQWLRAALRSFRGADGDPLPVVANLRCGVWYLPPEDFAATCHFKSTDGHYGQWAFSLSRPNVALLRLAAQHSVAAVVDSTRKGKEFPDAFNRTIPVWCLVLNDLLGLEPAREDSPVLAHLPGSERAQIVRRAPEWVAAARGCGVEWAASGLKRALRSGRAGAAELLSQCARAAAVAEAHPTIALVSCSDPEPEAADRCSWCYVQGAGDDHESWAQGLSPALFWAHAEQLCALDQTPGGCAAAADAIVAAARSADPGAGVWQQAAGLAGAAVCAVPGTPLVLAPLGASEGLRAGGALHSLLSVLPGRPDPEPSGCAVLFDGAASREPLATDGDLVVVIRPGSKRDMQLALPLALRWLRLRLADCCSGQSSAGSTVALCCPTGNDASVALAVACLAALSADGRSFDPAALAGDEPVGPRVSKDSLRRLLSWLTTHVPGAAPSRELMKQLNRHFCS
eukprot:TRINITY_DN27156_c1_g1_i2.p1 TRINITY_DN27156_c1_g1~~TRINITY_DN27156_c1_g1_i2.p1  ORF type:complete len:521 (+),score=107.15 TRINITY_DN27156_c1_g1_i2:57-1565(+)